jgi:archaellum component FlaC
MSSNPDNWPPPLPGGQGETVLERAPIAPDKKGLGGMIADAMSKSKGQGVVQGSTLFFKNLAESVAHSNRNMKIGLAFLTAAFIVVSAGLGYLVVDLMKGKADDAARLKGMDSAIRTAFKEDRERLQKIDERLREMDRGLGTVRVESDRQTEVLRAEISKMRADMQPVLSRFDTLYDYVGKSASNTQQSLQNFEARLKRLEGR